MCHPSTCVVTLASVFGFLETKIKTRAEKIGVIVFLLVVLCSQSMELGSGITPYAQRRFGVCAACRTPGLKFGNLTCSPSCREAMDAFDRISGVNKDECVEHKRKELALIGLFPILEPSRRIRGVCSVCMHSSCRSRLTCSPLCADIRKGAEKDERKKQEPPKADVLQRLQELQNAHVWPPEEKESRVPGICCVCRAQFPTISNLGVCSVLCKKLRELHDTTMRTNHSLATFAYIKRKLLRDMRPLHATMRKQHRYQPTTKNPSTVVQGSSPALKKAAVAKRKKKLAEGKPAAHELHCPLTLELFRNPVVAMDGHTYEADAIAEWFREHNTSPTTNLVLASKQVVPNFAIKKQIDDLK